MENESKRLFQNKEFIFTLCLLLSAVIYYIYKQPSKSTNTIKNNVIMNTETFKDYLDKEKQRSKGKKSVTINLDKNYFLNIELLSNILRNLFNLKYEIHLIIKIDEKDTPDKYLKLMSPLIVENIIKKHVSTYL